MNHDLHARAAVLEVGDRVLVKVLAVKGKNKIADRWEDHPYVVIEHPNDDIPVYKVTKEDDDGPVRTLHSGPSSSSLKATSVSMSIMSSFFFNLSLIYNNFDKRCRKFLKFESWSTGPIVVYLYPFIQ